MQLDLQWIPSVTASGLYAASCVNRGQKFVHAGVAEAIRPVLAELQSLIRRRGLSADLFWHQVIPLSARAGNNGQLSRLVLARLLGHENAGHLAEDLAVCFDRIERQANRALPNLADELQLRSKPLREQWEARGPGLLAAIARGTGLPLDSFSAQVILVYPITGGGGQTHAEHHAVTIEAVLANARPELPEVLRLGWLLSQLWDETPIDGVPSAETAMIRGLAMIPPILSAAETVELGRLDSETINLAVENWTMSDRAIDVGALCDGLRSWWEKYTFSRTPWRNAVASLAPRIA